MFDNYRDLILNFYQRHKRLPSYQEIMNLVGFRSKNAVYKLVNKLIAEGTISKDASGRLIPNQITSQVPILGLIEAGFPSPAEAAVLDTVSLDDYLISDQRASYLLEVKGDSMIEAGIVEGDLVLVEKGKVAKPGDIVIARVDGDYTMKYYRLKGKQAYLEPANKKYRPIYPTTSLEIDAVVKAVIRKY